MLANVLISGSERPGLYRDSEESYYNMIIIIRIIPVMHSFHVVAFLMIFAVVAVAIYPTKRIEEQE